MAKKKAKKASKPRRARQMAIPGTRDPEIPELDRAAERYLNLRDERMATGEAELQARTTVVELMKQHGKKVYRFDDSEGVPRVVTLLVDEKISVKKVPPPKPVAVAER